MDGRFIGRYEGNTLVVETINYHPEQQFYGASEKLKVTERFTRVADDRLLYQFTIEDPLVWNTPWGGEYEMWASPASTSMPATRAITVSMEFSPVRARKSGALKEEETGGSGAREDSLKG